MKLRASSKKKTVHVFRQKVKATKFVNIKYSNPYFEISEMTTHTPCARDI